MKLFVALFVMCFFTLNSFSQSKKELLQEIKTFQRTTYFNATYSASIYDIKLAASKYFKGYKIESQDSLSISFSKIEDLKAENTWEEAKHIVTVLIKEKDRIKIVVLSDKTNSYSEPFTPPTSNPNRGNFKLNRLEFYRFMYHYFYGNLELSTTLKEKIKHYNQQQQKEKDKIIADNAY